MYICIPIYIYIPVYIFLHVCMFDIFIYIWFLSPLAYCHVPLPRVRWIKVGPPGPPANGPGLHSGGGGPSAGGPIKKKTDARWGGHRERERKRNGLRMLPFVGKYQISFDNV